MFIKVSEFKAKCLGVIEDIRKSGETIIITKHGKPVAKLVPYAATASLFGCMKGQMRMHEGEASTNGDDVWKHWDEERNL